MGAGARTGRSGSETAGCISSSQVGFLDPTERSRTFPYTTHFFCFVFDFIYVAPPSWGMATFLFRILAFYKTAKTIFNFYFSSLLSFREPLEYRKFSWPLRGGRYLPSCDSRCFFFF